VCPIATTIVSEAQTAATPTMGRPTMAHVQADAVQPIGP